MQRSSWCQPILHSIYRCFETVIFGLLYHPSIRSTSSRDPSLTRSCKDITNSYTKCIRCHLSTPLSLHRKSGAGQPQLKVVLFRSKSVSSSQCVYKKTEKWGMLVFGDSLWVPLSRESALWGLLSHSTWKYLCVFRGEWMERSEWRRKRSVTSFLDGYGRGEAGLHAN